MTAQTQMLLEKALALPEDERQILADRLIESLPRDIDEMTEEEFKAELERRGQELIDDPSQGIPWSVVKKMK